MQRALPSLAPILEDVRWPEEPADDWLRGGIQLLRCLLRRGDLLDRSRRVVEIGNRAILELRDHGILDTERSSKDTRAHGAFLLLLLIDGRLREQGPLGGSLADVLLETRARAGEGSPASQALVRAAREVSGSADLEDFVTSSLQDGFPVPMDVFLDAELRRCGWPVERSSYAVVQDDQARQGDADAPGGPEQVLGLLGRVLSWSVAYPEWSFELDGWGPIRLTPVRGAPAFEAGAILVAAEGKEIPRQCAAAYERVRERVLLGKAVRVRGVGSSEDVEIQPRIEPRERAGVFPAGYLRSLAGA